VSSIRLTTALGASPVPDTTFLPTETTSAKKIQWTAHNVKGKDTLWGWSWSRSLKQIWHRAAITFCHIYGYLFTAARHHCPLASTKLYCLVTQAHVCVNIYSSTKKSKDVSIILSCYFMALFQVHLIQPVLLQRRDLLEQPLDFYELDVLPATQPVMSKHYRKTQWLSCLLFYRHSISTPCLV